MFKSKLSFKALFFLLVTLIILFLVKDIPETNAFLKDIDNKQSLTGVGDLKVSVIDETVVNELTISDNHSRDIFVRNEGDLAVFVRVLIHPTLENNSGTSLKINKDEVLQNLASEWVNGKDGYYYYQKKLAAKTETKQPIFEKIVASTNMEPEGKLTIYLKVEAITTKGMTYRDSWWEGKKPSLANKPELLGLDEQLQKLLD